MAPRKPAGDSWESWVERQIREARERGDFEDLPGAGRPNPQLAEPYDENWWIRRKLERENLSWLPPTLRLRKDVEDARKRIAEADGEQQVREIVAEINRRIRRINRTAVRGPPSTVSPLDEKEVLRRWRESQDRGGGTAR